MPKRSNGAEVGATSFSAVGLQAGGYSCRLDVTIGANPGYMILSTDEGGIACYRNPGDTRWKQLFRYGDNIAASEAVYKGNAFHAYCVARSSSNPNVMVASMYGKLYRTTSGAEGTNAWTKLSAYKSGNIDTTLHHEPDVEARLRGPTCQIDPVNENIFLFGNPVDGAYLSTNGGTAISLVASIPAPINGTKPNGVSERYGVNFAFDLTTASGGKCQTVYCSSAGNAVRRSTTGADGTFTSIGGPLEARDMFAAGGVLWVCDRDQKVWKWNGTTWTKQLQGGQDLLGSTVAVRPSNSQHLAVLREGGGIAHTTDGGSNWTQRSDTFAIGSGEPAWFKVANVDYLAPGMMRWVEQGGNRWVLSMGIGVCEFDSPPRVADATKWRGNSLGILELIPTNLHMTGKGNLLVACHDRAIWGFPSDNLLTPPTGHGPNYLDAITHGTDVDSIVDDPDFVVSARYQEGVHPSYFRHTGGGVDPNLWEAIPDPGTAYKGGNIVALSRTNYIILPTSNVLGPKYTLNGGTAWLSPVFRLTPGGTVVDMSAIGWGSDQIYAPRRKILVAIEGTPGGALLFVSGNEVAGDNRTGIWKTIDGGANWVRIFAGHMNSINLDYFSVKMRRVRGSPNAWFWATGSVNGPVVGGLNTPSGPATYFTNDLWATRTLLSGFDEVFDIAVGPSDTNSAGQRTNSFGWVYIDGWRSGQWRIWISKDFNPANPNAATWTGDIQYPGGHSDADRVIAADPRRPGQYVVGIPAGGAYLRRNTFTAKAA